MQAYVQPDVHHWLTVLCCVVFCIRNNERQLARLYFNFLLKRRDFLGFSSWVYRVHTEREREWNSTATGHSHSKRLWVKNASSLITTMPVMMMMIAMRRLFSSSSLYHRKRHCRQLLCTNAGRLLPIHNFFLFSFLQI